MALGNDAAAPRPARCGCTDVDALWRQHAAYLRAVIARYVGDADVADDVEQDVWLAIVRGLPDFDGRASFRTWAHRVAVTRSLNALRDRRRRLLRDHASAAAEPVACSRLAASDPVLRERVHRALRAVGGRRAAILYLRCVAEHSHEEIAAVLGITSGGVRAQYARGRLQVAAALAGVRD